MILQLIRRMVLFALLIAAGLTSGCFDRVDPLSSYEPEVTNSTDSFEFQVTGVNNLTTSIDYNWRNNGSKASINQASSVTGGSAKLTIFDADGVEIYHKGLDANGTFQTDSGKPGVWSIQVTLSKHSGSLNFRVEKL